MSESSNELDHDYLDRVSARGAYANTSLTLVGVGIQIFMVAYGLSVFLETPKTLREGRKRYITISFILMALSVLSASLDSAYIFQHIFGALDGAGFFESFSKDYQSWNRVLSISSFTLAIFIGDALLVYRCYVMWMHHWWITVLPGLTYLASIGMGILTIIPPKAGHSHKTYTYQAAAVFLTVVTNLLVTFLISFYLLHARRSLLKVLQHRDVRLYTGVVAILIESALPLSVFGIVYAALLVANPKQTTSGVASYDATFSVFACLFYSFSGLAPQMIIFRITTGRSWTNAPPRQGSTQKVSASIAFEHDFPAQRSFLGESRVDPEGSSQTEKNRVVEVE